MSQNLDDHETYRRPPFNAERIRSGVDLCVAALVEARARRLGVDPDDAMDTAEGEAGARRIIRAKSCRHCKASPWRPCVVPATGEEMTASYHPCRVADSVDGAA